MTCDNCKQQLPPIHYSLLQESEDFRWELCSLHCLTEFAWKLREQQEKLSKSKEKGGGA
jgi:hypothetical protein